MILIVDDDQAIRSSIALMLRQAQLEHQAVSNEHDCITAVRRGDIDLVILDMNLSLTTTGTEGIEILRKIKILEPQMPVILISAWGTIPLAVEGMHYGAADFVTKPWSNRDFMSKIRNALDDARRQREIDEQVVPLDDVERQAIIDAIARYEGNMSQVAKALNISRQSLYRRMEKLGIQQ